MGLAPGTCLGPYEVLSPLGAGGMGEVYRAHDTRLKRDVAIKILPTEFANDSERLARFQREAEVIASLNHPNIAAIHGLEESSGTRALVLELVEGETLADRIARGAIPLDEALPIARQIAEGLEAAHERGIVHRDLKPANIKITPDGTVKVLDFGLAKALEPNAASATTDTLSQSPTITSPALITGGGVLLGTAAYMSPEQTKGRVADRRSDIWAFGCVLYEMLTGKPVFAGEDVSEVLAAVLRDEPRWPLLPLSTPSSIRRLLRRSLEKNPRLRLHHIGDARLELDDDVAGSTPVSSGTSRLHKLLFVAGGVALGLFVALGWIAAPPNSRPPSSATRLIVTTPVGANLSSAAGVSVVVSPDGKLLAFTVERPGSIYIRALDTFEARSVRGTEDGANPFFSPDGAWLGFTSQQKIKRVPVAGGVPVTICDLTSIPPATLTATWLDDGTIVFSADGVLYRVSAEGGTPEPLRTQSASKDYFDPAAIPGMQAVLVRKGASPVEGGNRYQVLALSLSDGTERTIAFGISPKPAPSGNILFVDDGTLWRVGFDKDQFAVRGTPVPLIEGVRVVRGQRALFGVSSSGTLAYVQGAATAATALVWLDRNGVETVAVQDSGRYGTPRISPDGKLAAVTIADQVGTSIWTLDLERGTRLRLTNSGLFSRPVWSPDGLTVTFQAGSDMHLVSASGGTATPLLEIPGTQFPDTWTPDGKTLIYNEGSGPAVTRDLWTVRPGDTPRPLLRTRFGERGATMAPDGTWLAFVSTDATRDDVYVLPFPSATGKVPVSPAGGWQPVWSRDGKELFFRQEDWMMAAPVQREPFRVGIPRRLFAFERRVYGDNANVPNYDVAPDGRFLAVRQSSDPQNEIRVIVNWANLAQPLAP